MIAVGRPVCLLRCVCTRQEKRANALAVVVRACLAVALSSCAPGSVVFLPLCPLFLFLLVECGSGQPRSSTSELALA